MKISCNVIKDLLPLYIEKISSKESDQLIEEHTSECEECKKELELLKSGEEVPSFETNEPMPLKILQKSIRVRKRKSITLASLIVFLVMFTIFSYLSKPIFPSLRESGITVEKNEKGEIYANFSGKITAYKIERSVSENGSNIVEIEAWTSAWDKILGKATPAILVASGDTKVDTVYYCENSEDTDGDNMKIVYGVNPYPSGGVIVLPRLVLGNYFLLACVLTLIFAVLWFFVRKIGKVNQVFKGLFFAPFSYIISVVLLQNGFVTFSAQHDFTMNMIAACAIWGISILGISLIKQYREDRKVQE